jgi:riboflavin synthase
MFTGIIETLGHIVQVEEEGTNCHFKVESSFAQELKVDQSVAHDGVCLTVTKIEGNCHWVTAVKETQEKTTLGDWRVGGKVNVERCMLNNGRFDGHIVQGHVDQTGLCESIEEVGGSWLIDFSYDPGFGNVTVEKGSICINGVSLTCFQSAEGQFRVTIIPYTWEHTNFHQLKPGNRVNLEFDIIGKYVARLMGKG